MRLRKTNNWHRFAAVETHDAAVRQLRLFWERWECLHPNHEIFRIRDKESLGRTLPMLVHGDEGRGPKRQAVMCLSAASILGQGVATKSKRGNRSDVQLMNYIGHTFITRFLLGILPKKAYENCPAAFHQFVRKFAEDLRCLATDGVISSITGQTHYVAVLHIKGDWPFLAKVGELTRSFSNQPKQASSQKPCTGICHYCLAGRPDIPFEDMSMDAEWQFSVGVERPWKSTPVIFKIPHDDTFPESFLAADPFHTWHLGEGRNFVANCVAMMLEQAPGGVMWKRKLIGSFLITSGIANPIGDSATQCDSMQIYFGLGTIFQLDLGQKEILPPVWSSGSIILWMLGGTHIQRTLLGNWPCLTELKCM